MKNKRVLIACEFSGIVRDAFLKRGHDAWSCDLLPSEKPGPHIQGDVLSVINQPWDLLIGFPSCQFLCSSGIHWNYKNADRWQKTHAAVEFARTLMSANIKHIAIENPIGILSTQIRKPDQILQPYQFGHDASKKTCLWLKNLPTLKPTKFINARIINGLPRWANQTNSGQNKLSPGLNRWRDRSRTYTGIAEAMADQWGNL